MSGEGIISEDTYHLLMKIKEKGSLKRAAEEQNMSYRKAWGDIKKAEEMLEYELTEKTRGGIGGGRSKLTGKAEKLLEAYHALHKKFDESIEEAYQEFRTKISNK